MILLLLVGVTLAGIGAALLARAVVNPGLRGAAPVAQIQRYGFTRSRREASKADIGGLVDRAADRGGGHFVGKSGRADAIRRHPVAARVDKGKGSKVFRL